MKMQENGEKRRMFQWGRSEGIDSKI